MAVTNTAVTSYFRVIRTSKIIVYIYLKLFCIEEVILISFVFSIQKTKDYYEMEKQIQIQHVVTKEQLAAILSGKGEVHVENHIEVFF